MTKVELNQLNEAIKHCDEVIENLKLKGNCDECLKQHEQLKEWLEDYKFIKEKIEWLKEEMTEQAFNLVFSSQEFLHSWYKGIQIISAENAILQKKLSDYENPQPYKFEDLKVGMFVYSEEVDTICLIIQFHGYEIKVLYHEFDVFNRRYYPRKEMIGFCDDSVFPITRFFWSIKNEN